MEKEKKISCPMHAEHPTSKKESSHEKDCCEDTVEVLKPELNLPANITIPESTFTPLLLGIVGIIVKVYLFERESLPTPYQNYKPPLLVCDLIPSLQTFLC